LCLRHHGRALCTNREMSLSIICNIWSVISAAIYFALTKPYESLSDSNFRWPSIDDCDILDSLAQLINLGFTLRRIPWGPHSTHPHRGGGSYASGQPLCNRAAVHGDRQTIRFNRCRNNEMTSPFLAAVPGEKHCLNNVDFSSDLYPRA
jgi:hypothetical protein